MPHCVLVRDRRVPAGGFETWVETLANGLPGRGIDVVVLVPGGADGPIDTAGSRLVAIPAASAVVEQAKHILAALAQIAARGESGVFFSSGYSYVDVAAINLRGGPFANVPVLHGRDPGAYDWLAAGPPAKIVSPSAEYARTVRRALRPRIRWWRTVGRVTVIPHGVALPDVGAKFHVPVGGTLELVAALRLTDDVKRPFDLLEIARLAQGRGLDVRLTIAGSGPAEERMRAMAPSNVRFAGIVPRHSMPDFLLAADMLISTSSSEAFGLSIAEALAAGCAVIAADAEGPVRELVSDATGRRVPVADIGGFVDAIEQVAPRARHCGRAGRALIESRFSEDRMLDGYASLIRTISGRMRADRNWLPPSPMFTTPGDVTLPPLIERVLRKLRR